MKLNYDGKETINSSAESVWEFINNPEKVASCLPDVQKVDIHDESKFDAVVRVGVGPVRGKFKFKIELQPERGENKMKVKLRGGGLGSVIDLEASADILEESNVTVLDWNGKAVVRGPASTVGGRVLDTKAKQLIEHVFSEVSRNLNQEAV